MVDPTLNISDLLGALPSLADLAEAYWKTGTQEALVLAHRLTHEALSSLHTQGVFTMDSISLPDDGIVRWRRTA